MELIKHLQQHGLDTARMMADFGVRVTSEPESGLHLFKYSIAPKWTEPFVQECRGVILRQVGDEWYVASRPWTKFWNLHEGHCRLHGRIEDHLHDLSLVEKADGTAIQLWFDDVRDQWRVSTLGTIVTRALHGRGETFESMFWATTGIRPLLDYLHRGCTWLFELCTPENRIVTKYERPHAVFLGVRRNDDGGYLDTHYSVRGSHFETATNGRIRRPFGHRCKDLGLRTVDDLLAWVEAQSTVSRYGEWPEGFVGYLGGEPVVKLKNKRYMELHAVGGGDIKAARRRVEEALFLGTLDDFENTLVTDLATHAAAMRDEIRHMSAEAMECIANAMHEGPFPDRKAYALAVQRHVPDPYRTWAYQRGPGGSMTFEEWLTLNYPKLQDHWDAVA